MTRYPEVRIRLRTGNVLALVAAVRHGLRRAGVDREEIHQFTEEALGEDGPRHVRDVCRQWVETEVDDPGRL